MQISLDSHAIKCVPLLLLKKNYVWHINIDRNVINMNNSTLKFQAISGKMIKTQDVFYLCNTLYSVIFQIENIVKQLLHFYEYLLV